MHYGMLPRANRGIFALNELPDLAGKVQVGLFNIMQEGDVQIKGYPVRLPLDVLLCFTANPEDYTARGKIITPLKDRIGSEVTTHYPDSVELGMRITAQEAWADRGMVPVRIPEFLAEVIERVAFEARTDKRIDRRSGVSQRMPISLLEGVVSNAERRAIQLGEKEAVPRLSDLYAALPAITGKIELEYEGELVGAAAIARELIRRAAEATFRARAGGANTDEPVMWFDEGGALQVADDVDTASMYDAFRTVPGLVTLVHHVGLARERDLATAVAACELVLEALVRAGRSGPTPDSTVARAPRGASPARPRPVRRRAECLTRRPVVAVGRLSPRAARRRASSCGARRPEISRPSSSCGWRYFARKSGIRSSPSRIGTPRGGPLVSPTRSSPPPIRCCW
jgi:magnesium chelatase subunit I